MTAVGVAGFAALKRMEGRKNISPISAKELMNFPEKYLDRSFVIEKCWVNGGLNRDRDFKLFGIGVDTIDGKSTSAVIFGSDLHFAVSEEFGGLLDHALSSDKRVMARIYCDVFERSAGYKKDYKFAQIFKIEIMSLAGTLHTTYEEGKEPIYHNRK